MRKVERLDVKEEDLKTIEFITNHSISGSFPAIEPDSFERIIYLGRNDDTDWFCAYAADSVKPYLYSGKLNDGVW